MSDAREPSPGPVGSPQPPTLTVPPPADAPAPVYRPPIVPVRPAPTVPALVQQPNRQPIWDPVNNRWILPPQPVQSTPMTFKFWPGPGSTPAPRAAVSLVLVAAVVAAISLVLTRPGLGWLLTGLALTSVAVAAAFARKPAPEAVVPAGPAADSASPVAPAATPATNPSAPQPAETLIAGDDRAAVAEPATVAGVPADRIPDTDAKITDTPPTETPIDDIDPAVVDAPVADATTVGETGGSVGEPALVGGSDRWRFDWRRHGERTFWAVAALALLSVGTFRAAGWLFAWCVLFALGSGALALSGGRTVKALFLSVFTLPAAVFRSPRWLARGLGAMRSKSGGPRIVMAIAISVLLLLVFGGLFAGADAGFAHLLGSILPPLKASEIARGIFCFIAIALLACAVGFLAAARPTFDEMPPSRPRRVSRAEWVLPLAVLNVIFAIFVFIQITVLFGKDTSLLGTSKAAMKGYAHKGFWELLLVSILTLTILMIAGRVAPSETRTDRTLLRVLLGGLTIFSIVIVLAALKRVGAYESAYGYTRLRVVVAGVELWFGLLFVLILVAGITLRASWLPRVIVASLVLSLFAGALANPDRYVAQRNVDRYHATGKLSVYYLGQLSADAVPVIETLPVGLRDCALVNVAPALRHRADDWRTWNTARSLARSEITGYRDPGDNCPDLVR